jgi:hypothetical protein
MNKLSLTISVDQKVMSCISEKEKAPMESSVPFVVMRSFSITLGDFFLLHP